MTNHLTTKKLDTYFISAGEHSGDLLGSDLVLSLREKMPKVSPFGITGAAMANAGVEEVASISELSVMGVAEVIAKVAQLRMLEQRILHFIDMWEPKFAVLIDNPGFHIRLAEQLKMRGVRVYQYVAPKLWAWGANRAGKLRENFDLILGILPFEEQFFKERGIRYTYVGSPLKDRIDKVMVKRSSLGLPEKRPVIACLPGSRVSEIKLNLPTIAAVRDVVAREMPDAIFIVPVATNLVLDDVIESLRNGRNLPVEKKTYGGEIAVETVECAGLRFVRGMSLEVMAAADVAIVASGTATLECALLGTPMAVVYTMSDLTYQIAKNKVKLPYVSLVNLMAGKRLVLEFIQDFSVDDVAREIVSLYKDQVKRKAILEQFEDIRDRLKGTAAENAAAAIAQSMGEGRPASPG